MNTAQIFCGICGKADSVSLLQHIRDDHNLTSDTYQQRCPNAPLFTPELSHALVDGMVGLATAIRKAVQEEQLYTTFSTRRLLAFARKITPLGLNRALEATILNKLPKHERTVVAELAQRYLPGLEAFR